MKQCARCGATKPLGEFHASPTSKDGRHSWCVACTRVYRRERTARQRALHAQGLLVVPRNRKCPRCQDVLPSGAFSRNRSQTDGLNTYCRECQAAVSYRPTPEDWARVLARYGGRCACCREARTEFLGLDYAAGPSGARMHTVSLAKESRTTSWLIQQGLPAGFRVLCQNCRRALGVYGVCPHQREAAAG